MQKLIDQFEFEWSEEKPSNGTTAHKLTEDRATLLFIIDTYNKHLFDVDKQPVRKTRETLDSFAKELIDPTRDDSERILFRFRQFFSSYRINEYSYIEQTFDDFRNIIWDFVDQLREELESEKIDDRDLNKNMHELQEAVESNSIEALKSQARVFVDFYKEQQNRRDDRRDRRINSIRENLVVVKKKLTEANQNMLIDHLTGAHNRKSFDDQLKEQWQSYRLTEVPVSLISLDIDHFKKFNDTYGHAIGDFVLIECVKLLKECFGREKDFVARTGGEEFAIILPQYKAQDALYKAEMARKRIEKETFVQDGQKLNFTISMGIAQLLADENIEDWMKRADEALYSSKNSGRNKATVSDKNPTLKAAS